MDAVRAIIKSLAHNALGLGQQTEALAEKIAGDFTVALAEAIAATPVESSVDGSIVAAEVGKQIGALNISGMVATAVHDAFAAKYFGATNDLTATDEAVNPTPLVTSSETVSSSTTTEAPATGTETVTDINPPPATEAGN